MTPDYSPAILKAFLHAHVIFNAQCEAATQKAAWRHLRKELRFATKLKASDLDDAYAGRLHRGVARAKLWAALGVFPADFEVLLDNSGNQEPTP